jgi:tetratricopeptide (TPR) repeat protein
MLLLAMLRELGVTSEVVLVGTQGGDALPELVPMPGNFNHMIVRAEIGGTTYWLDGTSGGTRLETIDQVPRFHYALPLRSEGAELIKLEERAQSTPDRLVRLNVDQSAGVRLPALFDIEIEFRGAMGAQWRTIADQGDEQMRNNAVYGSVSNVVGRGLLVDETVTYDNETGVTLVTARGVVTTPWSRDDIEYELVAPAQAAKSIGFQVDRARADWRDIPLRLNGPIYFASEYNLTLPSDAGDGARTFELDGEPVLRQTIGGVEVGSVASLEGDRFTLSQTMRSVLEELPADQIPTARRELARFDRSLPVVQTSGGVRELWEYFGENRALLEPYEEIYAQSIAEADDDDSSALLSRAYFRSGIYDHSGAMEDIEAALAIEASRDLYTQRAWLRRQLGDLDGALADLQLAEDLQPDGSTYISQVEALALLGRADEALELAEDYVTFADDPVAEASLMASALGWAGSAEDGLDLLQGLMRRRPGDGSLLNDVCWNAAIWNVVNEERLSICVDAVEKSDYSAAALDSRALAHFRMGDIEAARADVDAALLAEPGLTASVLLRGIIKVEQGEVDAGREEIALALAMRPSIEATYRAWGLEF